MMRPEDDALAPLNPQLVAWIRTIGSLSFLAIPLVLSTPPFRPLRRLGTAIFGDLVPLSSLMPPEPPSKEEVEKIRLSRAGVWRQLVMVIFAVGEVGVWTGVFASQLLAAVHHQGRAVDVVLAGLMVLVWLYLLVRPAIRPPSTPPWPALAAYFVLWLSSLVILGMVWYTHSMLGRMPIWATKPRLLAEAANLIITTLLVLVVGGLHLASPEVLARLPTVAPDDQTTLLSWLSFSWVSPIVAFGNTKELEIEDMPPMSMTNQTEISFDRFKKVKSRSLIFRVLRAHRMDLMIDFFMSVISVILNYAGPFFLKRILDGLTVRTPDAMSKAYIFAVLAFLASSFKALSDVIHLYHGRRACVRIKSELTAAIYDKALRRRDVSGVVDEKEKEPSKDGKSGDKKDAEKDVKKANANTGKVVNLMSSDAQRVSNIVAGAYMLYSAPFEIIVASVFLYKIMGLSAFAGVVVLPFAFPLNSLLSKRSISINQTLMKTKDKRISVMTELINAIQFIKFFAWVEQWKERAAEARRNELKQLVRSLINNIWFSLLWNITPVLVTFAAFFSFIVIEKKELTTSVAFTSISLFTMLRMPLNIIPVYVVFFLNAKVSANRIDDFLNEDEVPAWVSSLKSSPQTESTEPTKIGFENATLRWNAGEQSSDPAKADSKATSKSADAKPQSPSGSSESTAINGDAASSSSAAEPVIFSLSEVSVSFPVGQLTVITGPTGSGKTAMLIALLGEMNLLEGKINLPKNVHQVDKDTGLRNTVAYGAQTPWLQQKSIKDNILFGEKFDEARYEATLEACALVPDLDVLEDGDQTEIGAKGVSLSGGQKARVALARAVYSYTQHVLLDDPLAAVDSHTAKHLTDKCLNGPLLKGRTVIIVSHHVELLLPSADYIVRILDGRIDAQGTPDNLRAAGELDGLVALEEAEVAKDEPIVAQEGAGDEIAAVDDGAEKAVAKDKKKGPGKKLVQDEERAIGNVKWETYKLYIAAATYVTWAWMFAMLVITQLLTIGERWWLKIWGEAYNTQLSSTMSFVRPLSSLSSYHYHDAGLSQHVLHHAVMNETLSGATTTTTAVTAPFGHFPSATSHPLFYLGIYAAIVTIDPLVAIIANGFSSWGQYRAAKNIHDRLLDHVLRATIRYFNITPLGRIINRFTRDIETIDGSLNQSIQVVVAYMANLISAIVVVAAIVPWFLVPAAIISYIYWHYSVLYLKVGRSLRRLEATLKSPIFSGFAEVLDGIVSVRAFSVEARFMTTLCEQMDKTNQAFYYYWMMNRWLLLRFDVLGAISTFLTTLLALSGAVPAGSAGMAILSSQSFVSACYWVSRFWGQLEMDFNSVERVQEYLNLPQEPSAVVSSAHPPAYWPSTDSGDHFLSAQDLEIKYAPDLPTVFKGSFDIKAGEKIGLIGRTGSGKSTLAMTLLRFTDPYSGKLILDGIDITTIGVDDLRSRITYIPQDAVLFSGTVRDNLDPFNEHTDEELIDALSRVNLGPGAETPAPSGPVSRAQSTLRVASLAAEETESEQPESTTPTIRGATKATITLTTDVSAGGSNFSQGQRQLVAMARALLRRSNLIIMDEATASVDFATDEAIQAAIRSEFKSSTLLTIAHRLSSVIDYDRLLVLSDGKVAEFDTPIVSQEHM
ncbi:putative ATP-binding cassette transporter protein YOR1 [Naematelia encephala]|uniref:Putative ATP-binding cassette transporter protein YOR1 n=1 Tax=Naematelia encephala TaxID=71784 RepID=A0A1Y2B469_9TREE|nr:putative ATP-binding cassette transporter protein YOR1 [Naematelia encephala]